MLNLLGYHLNLYLGYKTKRRDIFCVFLLYRSISGKSLASIFGVMLCPGPSAQ